MVQEKRGDKEFRDKVNKDRRQIYKYDSEKHREQTLLRMCKMFEQHQRNYTDQMEREKRQQTRCDKAEQKHDEEYKKFHFSKHEARTMKTRPKGQHLAWLK